MTRNEGFRPTDHEPREALSDQRLSKYLAGVGNNEGKALLLSLMQPNKAYTRKPLDTLIQQQGEKIWSNNIPFSWCRSSLKPAGFVEEKSNRPISFMITDKGLDLGTSFAGHLLAFSERYPTVALNRLLGTTSTSDLEETAQTPALNRLRIFSRLLANDQTLRQEDLMNFLTAAYPETNYTTTIVSRTLDALRQAGIITYESRIEKDKAFSFYKLADNPPEEPPPSFRRRHAYTQRVYTRLTDTAISIRDLASSIPGSTQDIISQVLAHLTRLGYAEHEGFQTDIQSAITLDNEQRVVLSDIVGIVEKFITLDPQFIAEGKQKAQAIVDDPERFNALMEKAYRASPNADRQKRQEAQREAIFVYLRANPHCTKRDVQRHLKEKGIQLHINSIDRIMANLSRSGIVSTIFEGGTNRYSIQEHVVFDPTNQNS